MLTRDDIAKRLEAARDAERKARTRSAQLRRELSAASRRTETQSRCALGGVLVALAARGAADDLHAVEVVRDYLRDHPPHDSNASVLAGTAFDPVRAS